MGPSKLASAKLHSLVRVFGHVDLAGLARGLRAARQVDRVAKETVAGHAVADHARHDLTGVDPNSDFLQDKVRSQWFADARSGLQRLAADTSTLPM